jgi:hypothetical protein
VIYAEVLGGKSATYIRVLDYIVTTSSGYTVCCGCFNLFCNVWVCVCVGVLVICVLVFTVLYCLYCVLYYFVYVYLFLFVLSALV